MTLPTRFIGALVVTGALLIPSQSGAIVPPVDCHTMKYGSKRYQVKADQVSCSRAKDKAKAYLRTHRSPSPFKCTKGPSGSKLKATCRNTKPVRDQTIYIFTKS